MVDQPRFRSRPDDDGDDWSDGRSERRGYRRSEPRLEQRLDQWMTAGRQLVDGVAGARPGSRASARAAASVAGPRLRPGDLGRWVENKIDWLLEDDEGWREPWQEPAARRRTGPEPVPASASLGRALPEGAAPAPGRQPLRRQPLDAISRRATPLLPEPRAALSGAAAERVPSPRSAVPRAASIRSASIRAAATSTEPPGSTSARPEDFRGAPAGSDQDWPDDASFILNRWRREPGAGASTREARDDAPAALSPPPGRAVPRSSRRRID